jgi:hypothetical protein
MLKSYIKKIFEVSKQGDAREESYYSALEGLLDEYAKSVDKKFIHVTTLPKKTEAGNPDFRIWDGKQHIIGYIEAKEPTSSNLDMIESSEQIKRYLHTFPNLILTNFFEFRLYVNGTFVESVQIARPFIIHKLKTIPPIENESAFFSLLEKYFSFSLPRVYDARNLAVELAKRTRFLRDEVITQELKEAQDSKSGSILGFYEAFKQFLIAGLSKEDFADLYSQTITYGLFAARTRAGESFSRKLAFDNIPPTIGILRDVFRFISLGELPLQMEWIVDDISEVLAVADVKNILHRYFHEGKGKDPIVHFYETFLSEYDPSTRERRGVYYTPEPVVQYIVRSLHSILKTTFGRKDGFASESVTVLDPAAGTLTFLTETAKLTVEEFAGKYGEGGKHDLIHDHVLKDFFAFELIMAPYAIGHLKMSFLLEELGYTLKKDDRFKLYLTNTLEMEELAQTSLPGMSSLSEESHLAGIVKSRQPILVILGNPPYSGHSANKSEKRVKETKNGREIVRLQKTWIGELIETYKFVDGKPLGEKNPKWLQDDYVKFIRFSQWKIDQAGEGVVGLITNHSYLDNPTFRGMRQSLMKSFDEIYILDLHGNALKKETCPDGSKDENVFDIRQGVAIALFIKRKKTEGQCQVYHAERWGMRENKYGWLEKNDYTTTKWKKLNPKTDTYFFIPRDEKSLKQYEKSPKITEIFPVNSVGIVTSRDEFAIDFDREALERRIRMFIDKKMPDEIIEQTFNLKDKDNWILADARENVRKDKNLNDAFTQITYRPFDKRWIFYHDKIVERSRREVMRHLLQDYNVGIIANRQIRIDLINHVFISDKPIDLHILETANASAYFFPLYLYPVKGNSSSKSHIITMVLFEPQAEYSTRVPNISKTLYKVMCAKYKADPTPEQILSYVYGILYSETYRTKYSEFLKSDFPRIPFTDKYKLFSKMSDFGQQLIDLHLLKSKDLDKPVAKFQGKGNNKVEKLRYDESECRVYINPLQYFEGVQEQIWNYQIGGYQVCEKWLKDRKDRTLNLEEIKQYCKIVSALEKTVKLQSEIDELYPAIETDIIALD